MNLAQLRVGDVIALSGAEWVIDLVNDCRARARCLSRKMRTVKDGIHNVERTFAGTAEVINISNLVEPDMIVRHDKNLVNSKNKQQTTEEGNSMTTKTTAAAKTETKKTEATHTGLLGGIFGFSVTSVLRALGKAGVATAHAREIMKAQEVETSDITVSIQVNAGRRGKGGPPAELSASQLKQLTSSAKAPEAPAKSDKPTKSTAATAAAKKAAAAKKDAVKTPAKKDAKPAKKTPAAKEPAPSADEEEVVDAE